MVSTTAPENHQGGAAGLRPLRHVYTANDAQTKKGVFTKMRAGAQETYDDSRMAIDNVFTASTVYGAPSPSASRDVNLSLDIDEQDNHRSAATPAGALSSGVVSPGGTVCRVVDLAPRYECVMHRARNLDYAVVIEGSVVLTLDSGEEALLARGDVAVQRAASHGWRNPSATEWARMVIVLQDCQQGGAARKTLSEDTGDRLAYGREARELRS
ncbi:hypothetical protein TOPH_05823 [Tolypocladium ophioglossoides CBS 100239]|uniref:Cupin 2 conserved barrel domain-containing protein n=1 Tax=Tolypocladium ophioglossoides (strain CBS 100239) TaxID=1163406 RepID=A0A0L0N6C8_TOLOC|nr:hypothetical protein TOPH_05823 [Tolypocladium ophioglossoides CBS 100239]